MPSAVHKILSSQDFHGHHCVNSTFTPWSRKASQQSPLTRWIFVSSSLKSLHWVKRYCTVQNHC